MPETYIQTVPIFRIFSREKAIEFYVDYLGFTVDWEHRFEPELPLYMQVSRGGLAIHLSEHHGDCCPGSAIRVRMHGVVEYHQELSAKNYGYLRPGIEHTPWDANLLVVIDPFGNKIHFAEPLEAPNVDE